METLLRHRLSRFFANHSRWKAALREIVSRIQERQWPAVVFGGVPRDLVVFGNAERPRDIDIVLDDVSVEEIRSAFCERVFRETRFGGVNLRVEGWLIDIWPLRQTWAFREFGLPVAGFQDLPRTTFLNLEAVAVDLTVRRGQVRNIYSSGFFEGVHERVLDINFEPNPFPGLCVVRSLIMAARLGFRIGSRLASYISNRSTGMQIENLEALQLSHYGGLRCRPETLKEWLTRISQHVQENPKQPYALPVPREQQLHLWEQWSPTC
jgi:hypothetical protein